MPPSGCWFARAQPGSAGEDLGLEGIVHASAVNAGYLAAIVGRPVIDKTGFKDRYDVDLKFDPCSTPGGLGGASPPGGTIQDRRKQPSRRRAADPQYGSARELINSGHTVFALELHTE